MFLVISSYLFVDLTDLATGKLTWKVTGIHPARKALLCKNGVLVALPSPEEPDGSEAHTGLTAFRAVDGKKLWEHEDIGVTGASRRGAYLKHVFACGNTLYLPRAFNLKTGRESLTRRDPVSGAAMPLGVYGQNFCGTISAGKHITAYRSASVGFEELHRDSGSFWLPEVRPSCWISVIPAGGILLAPEGYSTCVCSYNYKTSLALFPEPRQEDWGIYLTERPARGQKRKKGAKPEVAPPVKHLWLNLNAPGDKLDAHNQAWLSYPKPWLSKVTHYRVKGVPIAHEGGSAGFLLNADRVTISGTDRPWLYTSGLTGAMTFTVRVSGAPGARYDLRLHFAELRGAKPGDRQFDVRVQGKGMLERLDVSKEAGGANVALIREIPGIVPQQGSITIELAPVSGRPPLLCAFEVVQEAN